VYHNPVTKEAQYSVQLGASSMESLGWGPRFTCKMEVLKSKKNGQDDYALRFVLRSSVEEWPVEDHAYIIIDETVFPLTLKHAVPVRAATHTGTDMQGMVSITTNEWQVIRTEATEVEEAIDQIGQRSSVSMLFYSGSLPVTFKLDDANFAKLLALMKVQMKG
jgi:hypothetical protein